MKTGNIITIWALEVRKKMLRAKFMSKKIWTGVDIGRGTFGQVTYALCH